MAAEAPHAYYDAMEFPSGEIILVTNLCEGQQAVVLQLPAGRHDDSKHGEIKTEEQAGTSQQSLT